MFFSIAQQTKQNYPHQYQLGSFVVNTDSGWHTHQSGPYSVVYKGYVDHDHLSLAMDKIISQSTPEFLGNFCALIYNTNTGSLKIQTDLYRSFPIYVSNSEITNLVKYDRTIWTDSVIEINSDLTVNETKVDVIGEIDTTPITLEQALNEVDTILDQKAQQFIKFNHYPIKAFLSGGVDSLLVYSYLQKHTNDYELVKCQHIDFDHFWLMNYSDISQYWGYAQIHHWIDPCILTSGAPGDEFMLRSPTTADLFLKAQGISVYEMMQQPEWQNCLHYLYFQRDKNLKIFETQTLDSNLHTTKQLFWHLCNILLNDWQHWHIGNTLTWTPLRDLRIFKILLRLNTGDAIDQIMNSRFSLELVEKNYPGLSKVVSDRKNAGSSMKNLVDFYSKN